MSPVGGLLFDDDVLLADHVDENLARGFGRLLTLLP